VPLIFRFPGRVPAGVEVAEAVSLRDLAATITDMAGQTPAPFPGVSLAPLVHGREIEPSPVLSEVREGVRTPAWLPLSKGPMATVVTDGFQYIRNGDGGEELFHLPSDPDALTNLAASPEHAATLERLRLTMDDLRDNRPSAPPVAAAAGSK
jgi:arylsulfatase A-like enzyme